VPKVFDQYQFRATKAHGAHKKAQGSDQREKTSLGWAYVIYIDGKHMGAGLTRASAADGAKRMLEGGKKTGRPS
jgi:hypothetical protein